MRQRGSLLNRITNAESHRPSPSGEGARRADEGPPQSIAAPRRWRCVDSLPRLPTPKGSFGAPRGYEGATCVSRGAVRPRFGLHMPPHKHGPHIADPAAYASRLTRLQGMTGGSAELVAALLDPAAYASRLTRWVTLTWVTCTAWSLVIRGHLRNRFRRWCDSGRIAASRGFQPARRRKPGNWVDKPVRWIAAVLRALDPSILMFRSCGIDIAQAKPIWNGRLCAAELSSGSHSLTFRSTPSSKHIQHRAEVGELQERRIGKTTGLSRLITSTLRHPPRLVRSAFRVIFWNAPRHHEFGRYA